MKKFLDWAAVTIIFALMLSTTVAMLYILWGVANEFLYYPRSRLNILWVGTVIAIVLWARFRSNKVLDTLQ